MSYTVIWESFVCKQFSDNKSCPKLNNVKLLSLNILNVDKSQITSRTLHCKLIHTCQPVTNMTNIWEQRVAYATIS